MSIQEALGPASKVPLPPKQPGPSEAWNRQPWSGKPWRQGSWFRVEVTKLSPCSRTGGVISQKLGEACVSTQGRGKGHPIPCSVPLQLTSFSSSSGRAALSMTLSLLRMRVTLWSWKSEVSNSLALMPYSRVCLDMAKFFSSCKCRRGQRGVTSRRSLRHRPSLEAPRGMPCLTTSPWPPLWVSHLMMRVFMEEAPPR